MENGLFLAPQTFVHLWLVDSIYRLERSKFISDWAYKGHHLHPFTMSRKTFGLRVCMQTTAFRHNSYLIASLVLMSKIRFFFLCIFLRFLSIIIVFFFMAYESRPAYKCPLGIELICMHNIFFSQSFSFVDKMKCS